MPTKTTYTNCQNTECNKSLSEFPKWSKRKYCCLSCCAIDKSKNSNQLSVARSKRKWANPKKKPEINCKWCNKLTMNPKFCSISCSSNAAWVGKKVSDSHRKRLNRENSHRYYSKKKYQTPCDADLTAIKQFYLNCPEGYEVDHIIPISKGGQHSIDNLQYLTISENRSKGNKLNWCP